MMFYLQLRNELWKLFGKKRTYIGFGLILTTQLIFSIVFRYSPAWKNMVRTLESNGYPAHEFISGLTIATVMLVPLAYILMPLYVALIGGDLVAKEAEDGTLRMILARPISRLRLLFVKWLAGAIFSTLLILTLGVFGLIFSQIWFGWGGLFVLIPGELFGVFDPAGGLHRYAVAHLMLITKACSIMAAGFMFSCFNIKPAAATILALSFLFVNAILQQIPYFHDFQNWFLTYHLNTWQMMFAQPIPWWRIGESMSILLGFNFTFLLVGFTAFQVRDFKC
jgi:ABC-2 type transport system permease protein